MGEIATLRPRETVRQDVEAIAVIYRNLGAPVAEQMVTRALGELALTMAGIAEKVQAQELRDLARQRGLRLDLAFRSTTLDALRALDAGRCFRLLPLQAEEPGRTSCPV